MRDMLNVVYNRLPAMPQCVRNCTRFDPVTATVIAVAAVASAGATAYSANQEAKSAKKAAEAQKEVGLKQIEASLEVPKLATEAARAKLKAKQAGATQTILTAPGGMAGTDANVNQPTILGVPQ